MVKYATQYTTIINAHTPTLSAFCVIVQYKIQKRGSAQGGIPPNKQKGTSYFPRKWKRNILDGKQDEE